LKKFIMTAIALLGMATVAQAQPPVDITIDLSEQELFIQTPEGQALWPVSTGRKGYYTPPGTYKPYRITEMHYSKKYDDAPMPHSIFFKGGYAIHGTYDLKRLGRPASHGCVRLHPDDAELLYEIVEYYGMENTIIRIVP
jgi:lipoprotein-anchoring transpeptidase ErfK/SrfK